MDRRAFLSTGVAAGSLAGIARAAHADTGGVARVRPGDPDWPSEARWQDLADAVGGQPSSPTRSRRAAPTPAGKACAALFDALRNPYFISDTPALTQTSGWADAWTSAPSAYAVRARSTGDVVAAVNFARENRLRLVVKGGGHSYQGTSASADLLLIWTREMDCDRPARRLRAAGLRASAPAGQTDGGGSCLLMTKS